MVTYIAYPNNPTANLFDEGAVERIVAAIGGQKGLVVLDEAYQPFSSRSWMARAGKTLDAAQKEQAGLAPSASTPP